MALKIGVFDSGVGGITVLRELQAVHPQAQFVYLGDTAHVPYGAKSSAQILRLSTQCAKKLKRKKIDALVVACNTASSLALGEIQAVMGATPVYGVVEPGVRAALRAYDQQAPASAASSDSDRPRPRPILVLATRATVLSHAYGKAFRKGLQFDLEHEKSRIVVEQACPLLAPMIEEGWVKHPLLARVVKEYVAPYLEQYAPGVALLACTHYPWIQEVFEAALPGWQVVNSAQAVAAELQGLPGGGSHELAPAAARVRKKKLPASSHNHQGQPPQVEWIFTDPQAVPAFAQEWIAENHALTTTATTLSTAPLPS